MKRKNYYERYKSAQDGIELVLGRGGDQCIVRKEGKDISSMEELH